MMPKLDINTKMKKRLEWIDKNDALMVQWLIGYIQQHGWVLLFNSGSETQIDYIERFLKSANSWEESAQTREQCRNMKSAWKGWKKREDNRKNKTIAEGNYTISMAARKELEQLAKKNKCSFSKVIETLLVNAKDIEHLQKTLNKPFKDKNYGYRVNTQFFATFFQNDTAHQQAKAMTQMLQQEIALNKKQSREELEKLKKNLKEAQGKIAELTAIIED
ncbi:hypothetical protein BCU90_23330 [Vibrio lentus]|uniref:hypothetical protein n=1 Tax=Vibrio lentus TaxID=136468 RepID=UPI000C82C3D7|nr:hypothetical protein [Vibrio lentus]PMG44094.1 hypothetical protein BCU90_23330 [Vibrio lentus]